MPVRRLTDTRDWETGESLATSIVFGFTTAIARTGPCEKLVIVVAAAVFVLIAETVVGPPKLLKLVPISVEPLKERPSMSPKPVSPMTWDMPIMDNAPARHPVRDEFGAALLALLDERRIVVGHRLVEREGRRDAIFIRGADIIALLVADGIKVSKKIRSEQTALRRDRQALQELTSKTNRRCGGCCQSTAKRLLVLSTANPSWSAAALLTEKGRIPAIRDIAAKLMATSVHLSRRIAVPSLSSNAGVISGAPLCHLPAIDLHRSDRQPKVNAASIWRQSVVILRLPGFPEIF